MVVEDNCCTFPCDILLGCDNLTKIPLISNYSEQSVFLKHKGKIIPVPLISFTNNVNQNS